MRQNRPSGSEGEVALTPPAYPYRWRSRAPNYFRFVGSRTFAR
jgi:hypothetical protein